MAYALLKAHNTGKISSLTANVGTYVYYCVNGNDSGKGGWWLKSYAISGGTIVALKRFNEPITCMWDDATYIYMGIGLRYIRYTVADGTVTEMERFTSKITSISKYSTVLYIGLENGHLCSF